MMLILLSGVISFIHIFFIVWNLHFALKKFYQIQNHSKPLVGKENNLSHCFIAHLWYSAHWPVIRHCCANSPYSGLLLVPMNPSLSISEIGFSLISGVAVLFRPAKPSSAHCFISHALVKDLGFSATVKLIHSLTSSSCEAGFYFLSPPRSSTGLPISTPTHLPPKWS